jgi:hypothetical protein
MLREEVASVKDIGAPSHLRNELFTEQRVGPAIDATDSVLTLDPDHARR